MIDLELLHKILIIGIILIPFYPLLLLKYFVYVPLLLSFSWAATGGCVLTKIHNEKNKTDGGFIYNIIHEYFPLLTESRVEQIVTFSLILITVISFHRLYVNKSNNITNTTNTTNTATGKINIVPNLSNMPNE